MGRYELLFRLFSSFRGNCRPKKFGITGAVGLSVEVKAGGFMEMAPEFSGRAGGDHRDQRKRTPDLAVSSGGS